MTIIVNNTTNVNIKVSVNCIYCKEQYIFEVNLDKFRAYQYGALKAQNAFDNLKPEEREMFISGICPNCWNEIFKNDDDENDN